MLQSPTSIAELRSAIQSAEWFSRLGTFPDKTAYLVIRDLEYPEEDEAWEWLPTAPGLPDPVHGTKLEEVLKAMGLRERAKTDGLELYRLTLQSTRHMTDHPLLYAQNGEFHNPARRAALYAVRAAVLELTASQPGFWCGLIPLYVAGYWPCGLNPDGRVVVL